MSTTEILRRPRVEQMTGLKHSAIYEGIRKNTFPKQVKLGPRAVGWRKEEVLKWLADRPTA